MAINETFKKVLETTSRKSQKLQTGGTFTYTSEALPIDKPMSRLSLDPAQYMVGQRTSQGGAPQASGDSKKTGVDKSDIIKADGETSEKAYYLNEISKIESALQQGIMEGGEDFLSSSEAYRLNNQLNYLLSIGPTRLKNNLDLRKENDKWLVDNEAGQNWAMDKTGTNYYIKGEDGRVGMVGIGDLMKDPSLKRRILTNSQVQSLISGDQFTEFAFQVDRKNDVKNSIGFNKAMANIHSYFNEATGKTGTTEFSVLNDKDKVQQAAMQIENGLAIVTSQQDSNFNQLDQAARSLLRSSMIDQTTRNSIRQKAVENTLNMIERNEIPNKRDPKTGEFLLDEDNNKIPYSPEDMIAQEETRIMILDLDTKLNNTDHSTYKMMTYPSSGSGSGSGGDESKIHPYLAATLDMSSISMVDENTQGLSGVQTLYVDGGRDQKGEFTTLAKTVGGRLSGNADMIVDGTSVSSEEAISQIKLGGVCTGQAWVKNVLIEVDENGKVTNMGKLYKDKKAEEKALAALMAYKASATPHERTIVQEKEKPQPNQITIDKAQRSIDAAAENFRNEMKGVKWGEDVNPDRVVVGTSTKYDNVVVPGGDTTLWIWGDDLHDTVNDYRDANPQEQEAYRVAHGISPTADYGDTPTVEEKDLKIVPSVELLLPTHISVNDINLLEKGFIDMVSGYDPKRIAPVRPLQEYNANALTTAGSLRKGGKIPHISFKDLK